MFRLANTSDLPAIAAIYDRIHTQEEAGITTTGWIREIYPTEQTAARSIENKEMYVLEDDGKIVACGRINQMQDECYQEGAWHYPARPQQVMVMHTLVVEPQYSRMQYGTKFLQFYENFSKEHNCPYLRIDTNARNVRARAFYKKHGYTEVGIVPCEFNGIAGVDLVLLEKKV